MSKYAILRTATAVRTIELDELVAATDPDDETFEVEALPVTDDRLDLACQSCGNEGTSRYPIRSGRWVDVDGTEYTQLCGGCDDAFYAHRDR